MTTNKYNKKQEKYPHKKLRKSKNTQTRATTDFFGKLNNFLEKNQKILFWVTCIVAFITSLLLFDLKVSKGGDDAAYIVRAINFVNDFEFPSFQGPLYPMLLSLPVFLFGVKLPLLKSISVIFIIGQFVFLFKAFRKNIPNTIFYAGIILAAFNAYILYYASQTYSEALFMFLQSILFFYFIKYFVINENTKGTIKIHIIIGFLIFLMGITRSVGYASLFAVILYLAIARQWKNIALIFGGFLGFSLLFSLFKKAIWGAAGVQFSTQARQLLQKDYYYPDKGTEDLAGFIQRFIDNSQIYLSKYFYIYLGFKKDICDPSTLLTLLTYSFFALAIFWAFKKNKTLMFTGIYLAVIYAITFLMLQQRWDSSRLVITSAPLVFIFVLSGFYYLLKKSQFKKLQFLFVILFAIVFLSNFNRTTTKIENNSKILVSNLKGDRYSGFTPDWVNYLKMATWVGDNIPNDVMVACRKPNLAQIFANRKFRGIYRMPSQDADTLIDLLKKSNVEYVIMASLRKFENRKTEYTINTIKRYLYYIQEKYPYSLEQVLKIGNDEPAYLFKIHYDAIKPDM